MRPRRISVEQLESRALMAALPYGAMPDDTGEYLLGDVYVTVVLMESNPALLPGDNNPVPQGLGAPAENWTANVVDTISSVKAKVQQSLNWWEDTLDDLLVGTPSEGRDLLNFTVNWQYADSPVQTGYEPIARTSNDFVLWMYDFLNVVGFNQTGNFSSDIRAYNNFKRQQTGSDWAFTVFVVNNEADQDGVFAAGGQFSKAFSFAGGRMAVIPADRPVSTYAHEFGHMFWAFDEYTGSAANYLSRRGYYNTANSNHTSNPDPDFEQADSIMANDPARENAWLGNITSQSSRETLGWRDTDGNGIFDVLDVPFTLAGSGRYDPDQNLYYFSGSTNVNTLPNQNSSGLQNDITINQIREVQYSIDDGPWQTSLTPPPRTYAMNLELSIPVSPGEHTIKIRTIDTRTGAMSPEFIGTTSTPTSTPPPGGVGGHVYEDDDADGVWDQDELPLSDWGLDLVDENGNEVDLSRRIEPNQYADLTLLNHVHAEALLTAVGSEVANSEVRARSTARVAGAGKVFANNSVVLGNNVDTWTASRQLRIDFTAPVSSLSLRAYSAAGTGFARLEAYNSAGQLVARTTSKGLAGSASEIMSIRRAEGDIAYAIAKGHVGTEVVLDTLNWGPAASATTNIFGAYSLASLPPGVHRIRVNPPPNYVVTTFPDGIATLTIAAGQAFTGINFGIAALANGWHNFANNLNVSGDPEGDVSPLDALLVINWLNTHVGSALPGTPTPQTDGYIDVNNDNAVTPLDALLVINFLNEAPDSFAAPASEGEDAPAASFSPTFGTGGEGEEPDAVPQTAADYYAANPLHFLQIAGQDLPCCCEECLGEREGEHAEHDHEQHDAPLVTLSVLDTATIGSSLRAFAEELLDSLEAKLDQQLPADVAGGLLDQVADAFDDAARRIDEALDHIAPEVTQAWMDAVSRARRRTGQSV